MYTMNYNLTIVLKYIDTSDFPILMLPKLSSICHVKFLCAFYIETIVENQSEAN